jgi:hypothetical protein
MINLAQFGKIAADLMSGNAGQRTPGLGLRRTFFRSGGSSVTAIQQNPDTGSYWAQLAQKGHKVVQFKQNGKYVAVSVDGKVQPYQR